MTHFRTYCIGDYDENDLCEKFSEFTTVPPYADGNVCGEDIMQFIDFYTSGKNTNCINGDINVAHKLGPRSRKLFAEWTDAKSNGDTDRMNAIVKESIDTVFKELYKAFGYDWNHNKWKFNDQGVLEKWSTRNPNTVFDYYQEIDQTTLGDMVDPDLRIAESCGFFNGPENTYTKFDWVGWFGMSEREVDNETAIDLVRKAIEGLPPDTPVYTFDCHI
jgi:hypothetical protein